MSLTSYNSLQDAIVSILGEEVNIIKESFVGGGDITVPKIKLCSKQIFL